MSSAKAIDKPASAYSEMISVAIAALKERKGSSRQAVANYIKAHYEVGRNFCVYMKRALKKGATNGLFIQTTGSGATGRFKLTKEFPAKKAATKKIVLKSKPRKLAAKRVASKPMSKQPKSVAKRNGAKVEEVAIVRRKNEEVEYENSECEIDDWAVEDDYEDEEESLEDKQKEVDKEGMIHVDPNGDWLKEVKKKLKKATGKVVGKIALASIKEASMATCIVRRGRNSEERIRFHECLAQDESLTKKCRKHHKETARKAKEGVVGSGTGMKLHHKCSDGVHLIVTNNHVIMNDEEAKFATVTFDYHNDDNRETGTRTFRVCEYTESLPRTTGSGDKTNLDYSLIELRAENEDDDQFLKSRGVWQISYEPSHEHPDAADSGFRAYPALMFSHPRGLAMRVSVGLYPDVAAGKCVSHIKHQLPSCAGSSGANILISAELEFKDWLADFMHYRHGWAVTYRSIYLKQVEDYNKEQGYEAVKPVYIADLMEKYDKNKVMRQRNQ